MGTAFSPTGEASGELGGSLEETLETEYLRSGTLERNEWVEVVSGGVKGVVVAEAVLVGVLRERKLDGKGMWKLDEDMTAFGCCGGVVGFGRLVTWSLGFGV